MRAARWTIVAGVVTGVLAGVGAGCEEAVAPEFPADYAATYVEVRGCRRSGDHELRSIRVLADPLAWPTYTRRDARFAEGAVVLKAEYDFADPTCAGPVIEWTVMRRLAEQGGERAGWAWQRVAADRSVISVDEPRCIGCHQQCGQPPEGHDGTCAVSSAGASMRRAR